MEKFSFVLVGSGTLLSSAIKKITENNGFIPLDTYSKGDTEKEITPILNRVVEDNNYRFQLYNKMLRFSFIESRKTVLSEIRRLIEYK